MKSTLLLLLNPALAEEAPATPAAEPAAPAEPAQPAVQMAPAVTLEPAPAPAPPPAPAAPAAPAAAAAAKGLDLEGAWSVWGLNQHQFMLGNPDQPLDDGDYVVQNLRLKATAQRDGFGVVFRADLAQGWWGVDNSPDVEDQTTAVDTTTGAPTNSTAYNPYKLFQNKDTNYGVHVDLAYGWVEVPKLPVKITVGRQYWVAGHGLVLEQDYEGVKLSVKAHDRVNVDGAWLKMSEGQGSYKAPTGTLMTDADPYADADLYLGQVKVGLGELKDGKAPWQAEVFGMYYADNSTVPVDTDSATATYLPNGVGYFDSRFQPNISTAMAFGLSVDGKLPVLEGLALEMEGDYLLGTDDVDNADHASGLLDINDGTLSGWNGYLKATQSLKAGIPMDVGLLFGMGSGDDDPTAGTGNINRIQTMGSFAYCNVWEDSIMPDVEGISPQGLGSPVSRGYREFQNTTAVQGKVAVKPVAPLKLEASYTWLHATAPVQAFDATGLPGGGSSQDLGMEVDANVFWKVRKGVDYAALFGYFMPGEAAGYLINGNTASLEPAWELKQTITFSF